jgi:hypothetical protein
VKAYRSTAATLDLADRFLNGGFCFGHAANVGERLADDDELQ